MRQMGQEPQGHTLKMTVIVVCLLWDRDKQLGSWVCASLQSLFQPRVAFGVTLVISLSLLQIPKFYPREIQKLQAGDRLGQGIVVKVCR